MAIQVSTFAPRFERISSSPDVLIEKTKQNKKQKQPIKSQIKLFGINYFDTTPQILGHGIDTRAMLICI